MAQQPASSSLSVVSASDQSAVNAKPPASLIRRFLDVDGDGTGVNDAIGDYSRMAEAEAFYIQPPAGTIYIIERMIVFVEDAGTFDSGSYGNGITLATGVVVRIQNDSGTLHDLTAGIAIKTNPQWGQCCYDAVVSKYGSGNESLSVRWTFAKGGYPLRLIGDNNERLEILLHDDFTDLVQHTFKIEGYIE